MSFRSGKAKGPYVGPSGPGGGTPGNPTVIPTWMKFSVVHTQFQVAALTTDIELYAMPATGIIGAAVMKPTIAWAGTGITEYFLSLGLTANLQKYMGYFSVTPAVSATYQLVSQILNDVPNFTAATSIRIAAQSVGANLNQSTAGTADIWLLIAKLT
jgi:hypothetical protein